MDPRFEEEALAALMEEAFSQTTEEMMEELCSFSTGTLDHIDRRAWKKFQDLCQ